MSRYKGRKWTIFRMPILTNYKVYFSETLVIDILPIYSANVDHIGKHALMHCLNEGSLRLRDPSDLDQHLHGGTDSLRYQP